MTKRSEINNKIKYLEQFADTEKDQKALLRVSHMLNAGGVPIETIDKILDDIESSIFDFKDKKNNYDNQRNSDSIYEIENFEKIRMLSEELKHLQNNYYDIQRKLESFMDRPRIYEKEAQKKLEEVNDKFNALMKIKDSNVSITDQITQVEKLTEKLLRLETDAQEMMGGISTVQLAKHYLDAKKAYGWHYCKIKYKKGQKNRFSRKFLNFVSFIIFLTKNSFQKDLFLYIFFILSLLILALTYIILIVSNSSSYKDLAVTLPMIWSAWFFQRKINTREKLYEVYNHKQKVMETYVAFKNSSYSFNSEMKMEDVLLDAIKKDPSDCIGKDNTTIVETLLDKLKGLFVAEKVGRNIRNYDKEIDMMK